MTNFERIKSANADEMPAEAFGSAIYDWSQLPIVLDLQTVALIFGVTDVTVKRWLYSGKLKGKKLGKLWRFDKEYIRRLVSEEESE